MIDRHSNEQVHLKVEPKSWLYEFLNSGDALYFPHLHYPKKSPSTNSSKSISLQYNLSSSSEQSFSVSKPISSLHNSCETSSVVKTLSRQHKSLSAYLIEENKEVDSPSVSSLTLEMPASISFKSLLGDFLSGTLAYKNFNAESTTSVLIFCI